MQHQTNRSYLLSVLLVILAFNYVDRLALGIVLQDIKVDLQLSDTQLGLLTGIAFALFYSVMGIPIARWADRSNRVTIITVTTALWSAAVALCGLAGNFVQLLLIRIGVAVGEAGCVPPAHSLIGDYFSRVERPKALATYMLGQPLSMIIGYFAAGWLNELYGWRVTFVLMGLPGLALAAIAWFTLRDPRFHPTSLPAPRPAAEEVQPSMKQVWRTLWSSLTFRHLVFCFAVIQFFGYGILQWKPAFFIRSFGLETGELGVWFALIYGVGGLIGTYGGGVLASRLAAKNEGLQLRGMAMSYGGFGVISVGIYLSPNHYVAFALMAVATVGVAAIIGPLFATLQTLVPNRMRAVSIAIIYLFANLIGMGLGPMTAGIISDALRPHFGEESLRYALMLLSPGYLWAGWHLWQASKTIAADVAKFQGEREDVVPEARAAGLSGRAPAHLHADAVPTK